MAKLKRQHFISRFYLRGFLNKTNKYIWVYEKGNPRTIKSTPNNVAVQNKYYTLPPSDVVPDSNILERLLTEVESNTSPVIRKICNNEILSTRDRDVFAWFLAQMMVRVPAHRKEMEAMASQMLKNEYIRIAEDIATFNYIFLDLRRQGKISDKYSEEQLRQYILKGKYDLKIKPHFSLIALTWGLDFVLILRDLEWSFIYAEPAELLLTSDNPVSLYDPTHSPHSERGVGLRNKGLEMTFPITKKVAFIAKWPDSNSYSLNDPIKIIDELNRRTIISAYKYVYAPVYSEEINHKVQKAIDSHPKFRLDIFPSGFQALSRRQAKFELPI